jgi:hypothetical protein
MRSPKPDARHQRERETAGGRSQPGSIQLDEKVKRNQSEHKERYTSNEMRFPVQKPKQGKECDGNAQHQGAKSGVHQPSRRERVQDRMRPTVQRGREQELQ